jgi:hypothetical protein
MADDEHDEHHEQDEHDEHHGDGRVADEAAAPEPVRRRTTKRRAVGLASAIALGFKEVFEPDRREEIVQEVDASGEPDREAPVELLYIKDQPRQSRARVRPWLFEKDR